MVFLTRAALFVGLLLCFVPRAQAGGWQLVFSDEFNGPTLDRQKWATRYIFSAETLDTFTSNGERQHFRDNQNHVFSDGKLGLVARVVGVPDSPYPYESGMLRSYQTFYYGYYEARVKTPTALGTWPSFWLNPDRDQDGYLSAPPEIDIFDNANNGEDANATTVFAGAVVGKTGTQRGPRIYDDKGVRPDASAYESGKKLTGDWHVYGMLWTPTQITFWLDGKLIFIRGYKWVDNDGKFAGPAHVLINLAVGGPWAGAHGIDNASFPQTFWVDYIHVCQLDPRQKTGGRLCGGSKVSPDPDKYAYTTDGAGNDLTRPLLHASKVSSSTVRAGDTLQLTHHLSSTVSTKETHGVYQYVVNPTGQTIHVSKLDLPVPTTQWAGKSIQLTSKLPVPFEMTPGKYSIYLAVGSPEEWDPEGLHDLRTLTLQYAPDAKLRERVGQPTRYKVADVTVVE